MDAVAIKESKYSEASFLITLCYFRNTSPSIISNWVLYWALNNILVVFDLIQSRINLQNIPTEYNSPKKGMEV